MNYTGRSLELRICVCPTGMAPSNIVRVNMFVAGTGGLPPEEITIAEMAKTKGYSTGIVGTNYAITSSFQTLDFAKWNYNFNKENTIRSTRS